MFKPTDLKIMNRTFPISVENVSKKFPAALGAIGVPVVQNLSISVKDGTTFLLVGPNGAGKTTLTRLILGLVRADSGKISVYGQDPHVPIGRQDLAYVPETPALFQWGTAWDNLGYFGGLKGLHRNEIDQRSRYWLGRLKLVPRPGQRVKTFSKGMRQKLALCVALMQNPRCLILDEPLSGLDPLSRQQILDVLLDLQKKGITMLICSHILTDMQKVAQEVLLINKGTSLANWVPADKGGPSLEDWYVHELSKVVPV